MYIYVDESGDLGWRNRQAQPFFVMMALVIKDKKSKRAISGAVTRAIVELRRRHQFGTKDPSWRVPELKGHLLRHHPRIRLRLLKRIARRARINIYAMVMDKRIIKQDVPRQYMRRYALAAMNILTQVPVPKNQRWVTMVVDSQARSAPTQPTKVRYPSKSQRKRQAALREQDQARQRQYTLIITSFFKRFLKRKGTHLAVWVRRSNEDRCIQASDILAHLMYEKGELDERWHHVLHNPRFRDLSPQHFKSAKELLGLRERRANCFACYQIVEPQIGFVMRPRKLSRQNIRGMVLGMLKKIGRGKGNRGA
jgi:hypothetical protein